MLQVSKEHLQCLGGIGDLIQIKRNELAILQESYRLILNGAICATGGNPDEHKYTLMPDGRLFQEPDEPGQKVLMAVPLTDG